MNELATLYQAIPEQVWIAVLGGSIVSLTAQFIKKTFGLESSKVIKLVVITTAFVAAALQYLLNTHAIPASILGKHFTEFYLGAEIFYSFIYKTATPFLYQVQNYKDRKAAVAAQVNLEVTTATPTPGTATWTASVPQVVHTTASGPTPVDF